MKKQLALLMAALMLMVTFAGAESASGDLFAQIDGKVFEFCSGAGAWSTELTVGENGAFTGNFHDSEMGETGENYPDGTLYGCSFHGQLSDPEPIDENAWTVKLFVEQDEGQVPEAVEDGIRYVTTAPYGLEKANTVTVFLPETPVDRLPEDFMIWSHLQEIAPDAKAIPYYAIWNEADEAGFIAIDAYESQDEDACFSGEWLEKDTQFTALQVTKKTGDGWDVEILSPVSHGAWVIRATAYYDSDSDAFVYSDGVKYNLIPGEADTEEEAAAGLWGTLQFAGTAGHPQLVWYDMMNTGGETVVFERAPGLPAYVYTGDNPMEGAIADFLACGERAESYLTEPGYVTIPCPIIHRTETIDAAHAKVYGSFWILNYVRRGETLLNISGGEYPGVIMLEKADGLWRVTAMEEAGDGEDYTEDIERFADGDQELADQYYAGADLDAEANQAVRTRFIKAYVEANGLNITAYQDYGWEPVMLAGSASAEPAVVTALASEINPDKLVSVAFDAKINACADGVFSITILVPERYDPEEIMALKAGDSIFTEGREVEIRSVTDQDGYIVLNAGTEDEICLYESIDMNYWIADDNDNTWAEFPSVTVQASEHFIFLDGINPSTGEALLHPTVHNMAGFLERMNSTDDSGFDIRNVEAVIDGEGKLAVIRRFYVPWQ